MSIVALNKVTLCGLSREKQAVLERLQRLGVLHLLSLRPARGEGPAAADRAESAYKALKYLLEAPRRRRAVHQDADFDMETVVRDALENQARIRDLRDQRDLLRKRIKEVEPWGDFQFPADEALRGYRLWFYTMPHYRVRRLRDCPLPWAEVHRDSRESYVVVIAREEPPPGTIPGRRTHIGRFSLAELNRRLERLDQRLEELAAEREAQTRWIELMRRNLARAEDSAALGAALDMTLDAEPVFALQAWVPTDAVAAVRALADERGLALLVEEPAESDRPPTLLRNDERIGGGQEVVAFYQMPGYRNWDPSPVLFFSFALFFAMILSDAGYALVVAACLLAFRGRLKSSVSGRRIFRMGLMVAAASLLYGVLAGSYFGYVPPAGSLAGRLHMLDLRNFNGMMQLAVFVGAGHLLVANLMTAWHRRGGQGAVAPLGWTAAIIGGLLLGYGRDGGWWPLALGLVAVVSFSDVRPLRRPWDAVVRLGKGVLGLAGVTKAFGDVLSYLRLFALGLASASLAVTFNDLALQARAATPGVGLLLFALILLVGHALNFALAVMSGVVHGLRLNVIEFYHWGVSDEGYPFRAFEKKEIEPWTT